MHSVLLLLLANLLTGTSLCYDDYDEYHGVNEFIDDINQSLK
jgi:hypothetical protein